MRDTAAVNRRHFLAHLGVTGVAAGVALRVGHAAVDGDFVEVKPREIDDVLVNPGMGFETGGVIPAGRVIRNYPQCSIAYCRFYWDRLEPEEGQYAFDFIEELLAKVRAQGQDLALRFMPMDTEPKAPAWYRAKEKGFAYQVKAAGWERGLKKGQLVDTWAPDFNSPFFLERQEALVQAFGERFNGHPDLIRMDIGSVGRWGEWHTSGTPVPMPTEENARRVIDWYFKYWNRTPLTMLVGYTPGLRYAIERGAGWRADSLGDYGHFSDRWCHMINAYPRLVAGGNAAEGWKGGPVTFEAPGSMEELEAYVPSKGGGYDKMWDQALAWGASSFHGKSQPIPDTQVEPMKRFLRRCGYRLVVRSLLHPRSAKRGDVLDLRMRWENLGVARPYRDYVLVVRLRQGDRAITLDTDAKLTSWLPGNHEVRARLALPADATTGDYELGLGVLDPHYREPEVKLAIAGRGDDGWYPMGTIKIEA